MTADATDSRYPIGKFSYDGDTSREATDRAIGAIDALPGKLRRSVAGLSESQLDTPYRDGGWTPRQVVHHTADSHANAYVRLKLALTEDLPRIKPYNEADWAKLADVQAVPIEMSLGILDGLHARWAALLRAMSDADWDRAYVHPEHKQPVSMRAMTALYAWHGRHHTAHIMGLRERNGWA